MAKYINFYRDVLTYHSFCGLLLIELECGKGGTEYWSCMLSTLLALIQQAETHGLGLKMYVVESLTLGIPLSPTEVLGQRLLCQYTRVQVPSATLGTARLCSRRALLHCAAVLFDG